MGKKAATSCSAVIAHHQAPLSVVRREPAVAENFLSVAEFLARKIRNGESNK